MEKQQLTILHTSDWHLGRTLYGRSRYEEFEEFLGWLAETIERERVDVLLIAGDIFDTSAPSNRAQQLYYRFLCRVAASACRHAVVIAGNHDSPSFLNAPRELLRALDVHVIGSVPEEREDEVLVLRDSDGAAELLVCAVPYLRDRAIRVAEAGESIEDKERKLIDGIRGHYAEVAALAEGKRAELGASIPIIGMGHLFTAGGRTADGDGVRELYVGSLAHVPVGIFPGNLDYLALGHLHIAQRVGSSAFRRYSGSPLPMGFGEAQQEKSVCLVRFGSTPAGIVPDVKLMAVPVFQRLERVSGGWEEISSRIEELAAARSCAWLEVVYEGEEIIGGLRDLLDAAVSGSGLEILRVKNNRVIARILEQIQAGETLDDLDVHDVFSRCLELHQVPEEQRPSLCHAYREVVVALFEADPLADKRGAG